MDDVIEWHNWLSALTDLTRSKIRLFHLNGNRANNFNRGKDIHEIIMSPQDDIWGALMSRGMRDYITSNPNTNCADHIPAEEFQKIKESSLYAILHYAKQNRIPVILEINVEHTLYAKYAIDTVRRICSLRECSRSERQRNM